MGAVNADLFAVADVILIPLNPTPADLRALVKALPLVRQSNKPFHFVLSRVRPKLKNNEGTVVALDALGLVLTTRGNPQTAAKGLSQDNRIGRKESGDGQERNERIGNLA
jgi:hypothetical protein